VRRDHLLAMFGVRALPEVCWSTTGRHITGMTDQLLWNKVLEMGDFEGKAMREHMFGGGMAKVAREPPVPTMIGAARPWPAMVESLLAPTDRAQTRVAVHTRPKARGIVLDGILMQETTGFRAKASLFIAWEG